MERDLLFYLKMARVTMGNHTYSLLKFYFFFEKKHKCQRCGIHEKILEKFDDIY